MLPPLDSVYGARACTTHGKTRDHCHLYIQRTNPVPPLQPTIQQKKMSTSMLVQDDPIKSIRFSLKNKLFGTVRYASKAPTLDDLAQAALMSEKATLPQKPLPTAINIQDNFLPEPKYRKRQFCRMDETAGDIPAAKRQCLETLAVPPTTQRVASSNLPPFKQYTVASTTSFATVSEGQKSLAIQSNNTAAFVFQVMPLLSELECCRQSRAAACRFSPQYSEQVSRYVADINQRIKFLMTTLERETRNFVASCNI